MSLSYDLNIRGFYQLIQNSGGVRYGHQFIVKLNFGDVPDAAYGYRGKHADYLTQMYGEDWYSIIGQPVPTDPTQDMTFFATSTSIPKMQLKTTDLSFLAAGFKFPGVMKYDETWSVTIQLDQKMQIYTELLFWKELMSSYSRNNGGNKTIPAVDGDVWLLDQYMQQALRRFKIRGIFIKELPEIQMNYKEGSNTAKDCACTFAMQWFEEVDVNDGAPLAFDGMGI